MRTELALTLGLSETSAGSKELGDHNWTETDDTHADGDSRHFKITGAQTDFEIDLSDIVTTGILFALRSNKAISVKLNSSGATAIVLSLMQANRYAYMLLSASVTKLYVTTTEDTRLTVAVAGDLA